MQLQWRSAEPYFYFRSDNFRYGEGFNKLKQDKRYKVLSSCRLVPIISGEDIAHR